jgi:sortase A
MRAVVRGLSSVLIVIGVLMLVDVGLTLTWQEPVSSVYARIQQAKLANRLEKIEAVPIPPLERKVLQRLPRGAPRLGFAARSLSRRIHDGNPVGRIRAEEIGLDDVIVEGTGTGDLRQGPGHYPDTPLPGASGTVAVAGHRTTYGAPFRHLDQLDRGDAIEVVMSYGRFTYEVERTRIVPPTAMWVTHRAAHDRLVLTACHPLYSAAQRIVVFARLAKWRARGVTATPDQGATA